MNNYEGDAISGLLNIFSEEGYNKDVSVRIGMITSISPLKIKIGDKIEFDRDDVVLSRTFSNQLDNVKIDILSTSDTIIGKIKHQEVKTGEEVIGILDGDEYYVIDRV